MSKGWYVKIDLPVVFNIDMNVGVVASTEALAEREAVRIVSDWLDRGCYKTDLEEQLPVRFKLSDIDWVRGSSIADLDFDGMMVFAEPDSDFDPEPDHDDDEDQGPSTDVLSLMEAAQCLNEAYHNLPEDHALKKWQIIYGIAEVRDQLSKIAVYCDMTYQIMHEKQGYDGCFDFDFVPQFLENCVNEELEPKSDNPHILSMYWSGIGA